MVNLDNYYYSIHPELGLHEVCYCYIYSYIYRYSYLNEIEIVTTPKLKTTSDMKMIQIMTRISKKGGTPQKNVPKKDDLKNEGNLRNHDKLWRWPKKEDNYKNYGKQKNEDDLIMKMTLKMDMIPKMRRCFPLEGNALIIVAKLSLDFNSNFI